MTTLRTLAARFRDTIVLTPQEKKAAFCVLGAFVLGVATQQYRAMHPRVAPAPAPTEQRGKKASSRFERVAPADAPAATDAGEDD